VPPWDVKTSIAKRNFGVAKRARTIRRKVAGVKL
jgi:hypothetical protein